MSTYNPDAPVENSGGFLQHTYQAQDNNMFYWNGNNVGGFNPGMGYNDGSRRNVMNPVNPNCGAPNPFTQFGQAQPQSIPESMVQPFASYPPSTPCAVPTNSFGLNSMVESRRNTPPTQTAPQNNPWAQPQVQQPQMAPQQNPFQFNQPCCYDPNMTPGFRVDMNTAALYGNNQFGFDKHNSWDNYYHQNRTIDMPVINWQQQAQAMAPQGYAAWSQPQAQYPVNQLKTSNQNWKDIAERNWSANL